ncbi:hypothetical protein FOZ63_004680, partial [Perkinsus olseni]
MSYEPPTAYNRGPPMAAYLGAMNDNSVCSVKRISDKLREPLSFSTLEDKDRLERDEHQLIPASSAPLDRHNATPLGTNGQSSPSKLHRFTEDSSHALSFSPATSLLRSEPRRNISPPRPARSPPNLGMPPAGNGRKRTVRDRASSPRRPEVEVVGDQPQRGTVQQEAIESVPLPLRSRSMSAPRIGPQRTSFATPARLRPSGSLIFPFSSTPRRVVGQRARVRLSSVMGRYAEADQIELTSRPPAAKSVVRKTVGFKPIVSLACFGVPSQEAYEVIETYLTSLSA